MRIPTMDRATLDAAVKEQRRIYDKAYADALRTNEAETQRWNAYRREQLELKDNLRMYGKAPRADILIPMGTKAFVEGQLYHTGEVLVSHGDGYFSECSSQQAEMIADRRIRLADQMLQNYEREQSLYSDKLEVPFANEAFATPDGGREILEQYDEQIEERWRDEHKRRVQESKQQEAKERAAQAKSTKDPEHTELLEKLEEMELLEELEKELDQLEMPEDDNQLERLMNGEIRLSGKKRIAHRSDPGEEQTSNHLGTVPDAEKSTQSADQRPVTQTPDTTNSDGANGESPDEDVETTDEEDSAEEPDEEDISPEFSQLLMDTKTSTNEEKYKTFVTKMKDVRHRLYQNSITIEEKVDLYQLYEELEEALDFLRPAAGSQDAAMVVDEAKKAPESQAAAAIETENIKKNQVRKISFAEQDQIRLIESRQSLALTAKEHLAKSEKTLRLFIDHSPEALPKPDRQAAVQQDEIVSPADIYRLWEEGLDRSATQSPAVERKSILKNKQLVDKEIHHISESSGKHSSNETMKQTVKKDSVAADVLGDIVEHTVEQEGTTVEMKQPPQQKKKVSRFKQQRQ